MENPKGLLGKASKLCITEDLQEFDEESVALLAKRLEDDDYPTPFDGLNDWHLLRAIAIHHPELAEPYLHLLDQELFDEE